MGLKSNAIYALAGLVLGLVLGLLASSLLPQRNRFVDVSGAAAALDTRTGEYCNPVSSRANALPFCHDLYAGKAH
jgi:small basic protein